MYTRPGCPFCANAKALLEREKIPYEEIDYPSLKGEKLAELTKKLEGYRTTPMIFIGEEFIKGFQELNQLQQSGKLKKMIK